MADRYLNMYNIPGCLNETEEDYDNSMKTIIRQIEKYIEDTPNVYYDNFCNLHEESFIKKMGGSRELTEHHSAKYEQKKNTKKCENLSLNI